MIPAWLLAIAAIALVPPPRPESPWFKPWVLALACVALLGIYAIVDQVAMSLERGL